MTPASLRAAIASARLRPRMYAQTAEHLASMLYGMIAGAAGDGVDIGPAWGDAYAPANVHAPTDAEVCDAAEATVAALWPQGDAFDLPDGDECFRTGDDAGRLRNLLAVIHRDGGHHVERVGIAQACVDAATVVLVAHHARDRRTQDDARERRAAEAGALDLDAIDARVRGRLARCACGALAVFSCERDDGCGDTRCADCIDGSTTRANVVCVHEWGAVDTGAEDDALALVARVRELEAEAADMREGVAYAGASCDREIQVHGVWLRASRLGPPSDVRHYAEVAAARDEALAEVERLRAQLAAAQPAPLDFHGALAAVRNGRFVPSSAWARCLACDGTCADVDGDPCEPCRGMGQHPSPDPAEARDDVFEEFARAWNADTDLCPKCGALDLDHTVEECARRWAEQHPGAAAGIVGAERAPMGET